MRKYVLRLRSYLLVIMSFRNKSRQKAKAVAFGGMFSALSVAIMSLGSVIPSLDMSAAFLSGIVVIVARMEVSRTAPISVYLVSGILSAVILPNRFAGISYLCFYGLYPIVKEYIERIRLKPLKIAVKLATLLVMSVAVVKLSTFFTIPTDSIFEFGETLLYVLVVVIGIVYDFFLTVVVSRYDILLARLKDKSKFSKRK